MRLRILTALLAALFMATAVPGAQATGNEWNDSFNKAKKNAGAAGLLRPLDHTPLRRHI